jgi:hypothetical protein
MGERERGVGVRDGDGDELQIEESVTYANEWQVASGWNVCGWLAERKKERETVCVCCVYDGEGQQYWCICRRRKTRVCQSLSDAHARSRSNRADIAAQRTKGWRTLRKEPIRSSPQQLDSWSVLPASQQPMQPIETLSPCCPCVVL